MAVVNAICKHGKQPVPNPVLLSYYEKKCKNKPAKVNCTPFVRQYGILKTNGVFYCAKREAKQEIYTGIQENGNRNHAGRKAGLPGNGPALSSMQPLPNSTMGANLPD
ncbi:hypothetical protein [Faecalibacterium sp. An77]|uniref:hypothetical protein n=2 Tax=unclassified Faecalibacterium TaxID=2646395 RepID=UPI00130294E6|nr:hypothetical protein [Faecalibacterium sp. An77]